MTWVHTPHWTACPSLCLCIGYPCCVGNAIGWGRQAAVFNFFTESSLAFQGEKFPSRFCLLSFSETFHVFKETEEPVSTWRTRTEEQFQNPDLWDELSTTILFLFSKREVQYAFCLIQCDFHRHWHWHLEISSSFGPWYICVADSTALCLNC